ncbi:hypothetical protein [Desulfobacula sp.]|uniref:hypothetical protein n=1 Tax=Desulfobacula sp. TaxID=2593537 RepID=UPI0025C0B8DA|nr:hypothetical protein [Desulfobacula sp.]
MEQFDLAMAMVKNQDLIHGQAVTLVQEISTLSNEEVILINGSRMPGERIYKLMPHATHLVLAIGTIGNALETLVRKFIREDNPSIGIMLDGIGSAAVDCLLEETSHRISTMADDMGLMSSSPISPGMPGLPLETQQILFNLLPADAIDVRLTSSRMMIPFKSSSMIIGLAKEMPRWSKEEVCKKCHLFMHCRYKKE